MSLVERVGDRVPNHPVLVVSLEGWIDAGIGASGAIAALLASAPTETLAVFDTEALVDLRARRPVARIVDGVNEGLDWPRIEMRLGNDPDGADVVYLVGPEPDFRWHTFVAEVVALAEEIGVRLVVGLGAFPAPAPHTRAVRLAATAPEESAELAAQVGVVQGAIEVPSGVWGALELAMGAAGIPTIGLWARVPHYVAAMPYPAASAVLVDGLNTLADLHFDSSELHSEGDAALGQVDDLIARSEEHQQLVRRLEENQDASEGNPLEIGHVPTGDELAAELENYLRGDIGGTGGFGSEER